MTAHTVPRPVIKSIKALWRRRHNARVIIERSSDCLECAVMRRGLVSVVISISFALQGVYPDS
ncbi:hypothetical protein KSB_27070 [Ktedonobacter robiniae]|uniref:Uncharacterized protein n=1 Tax=Ktedonobacter robiniae TaxID=2778365 RepID=A0ABQ3UNH6_9CHLR|nr:hypothetical protein KSB_27070 [Ktedonobacter robiniae]